MTVSEQVAPVVHMLEDASYGTCQLAPHEFRNLGVGIWHLAFEIDRLRARLRLVGIALTLLAIAAAAVMLRA